ncbi:hypothetical protein TNCT_652321 [Trichonephila clavata]|uniref:Uncharacterized protein n=1 Tax=Trichonephila clavata TaxID=2740835 RepID=A0A8X6JAZ8_TRICU|nr:hypothetical protein TNCT_652321 [Trichonephila clavata]
MQSIILTKLHSQQILSQISENIFSLEVSNAKTKQKVDEKVLSQFSNIQGTLKSQRILQSNTAFFPSRAEIPKNPQKTLSRLKISPCDRKSRTNETNQVRQIVALRPFPLWLEQSGNKTINN